MIKYKIFICLSIPLLLFSFVHADLQEYRVLDVDMSGPITPATEELLSSAIEQAEAENFIALLIRLDTPGGLAESMRNMVKDMLGAQVPIIVWVDPPGARATSAGVFLVAASDHAVMSPQTTIGSATPVTLTGEEVDTMTAKIMNEMLSLVRAVAREKGRNAEWYEEAITEAANIDSIEALEKRVIDHVAVSRADMFNQIGKSGLMYHDEEVFFSYEQIQIVQFEPGLRYRIMSWILHPQIAYLLFLAGMAGLFFELSSPGTIFPGTVGAFCLILGLYSLAVLPTNVTGILLLILGFIFIILEINFPTFGLLTLAAITSFFFGSLFLFDPEHPYFRVPAMTIVPTILILTFILLTLAYLIGKSQMAPKFHDIIEDRHAARIVSWSGTQGQIKIRGEIWRAKSEEPLTLYPGQKINLDRIEGLTAYIKPD